MGKFLNIKKYTHLPWTFRFIWISWTFRYLLDILDLYIPFGYLGPLGTFWKHCIFWFLLYALNLKVPSGY